MQTLILKLGAIGDVIMAIPAAHQLHLAGHTIDWVCSTSVLPILKLYPWIHPIAIDERTLVTGSAPAKLRVIFDLWRTLGLRRYDLVATLYYDPRYRLLTLPIRAARRIRLSDTDRNTRLLPGRHHTDEFARILLNRPDELNPDPFAPVQIPATETPVNVSSKPRILLAPAGARNLLADDHLRRWPPERYVTLSRLFLEHNLEVTLIGGPDDAWITPHFAALPVTNLIGKLTLAETLALLDASDLLITHDTGPLHMAGITRVSLIGIFGPTDPHGRLPQRPGTLALWGGEGFACRPCYDGHTFAPCPSNDCMRQITPQHVLAEALTLLEARANKQLPPPRVKTLAGRKSQMASQDTPHLTNLPLAT